MADGTLKNIEDVQVGDVLKTAVIPTYPNGEIVNLWYPASVWSVPDSQIGQTTYETTIVQANTDIGASGYYTFNDQISLTGDHFVFVNRAGVWQFMRAWSMQIGDLLMNEELQAIPITSVEIVSANVLVSKLTVGPNDLFFGAGILTHNIKVASGYQYIEPTPQ